MPSNKRFLGGGEKRGELHSGGAWRIAVLCPLSPGASLWGDKGSVPRAIAPCRVLSELLIVEECKRDLALPAVPSHRAAPAETRQ